MQLVKSKRSLASCECRLKVPPHIIPWRFWHFLCDLPQRWCLEAAMCQGQLGSLEASMIHSRVAQQAEKQKGCWCQAEGQACIVGGFHLYAKWGWTVVLPILPILLWNRCDIWTLNLETSWQSINVASGRSWQRSGKRLKAFAATRYLASDRSCAKDKRLAMKLFHPVR